MGSDRECKVDRVIERYGLDGADPRHGDIHDGLLARWTGGEGHAGSGYRTLTTWFNERLLRRVYDDHGRDVLGGRVEHDLTALTGDDDLRRAEIEESLEADGIDAGGVRSDLVSWGTMRTHLKECLDGTKDDDGGDRTGSDWERESIAMARSFAAEKVEAALSALSSKGELDGIETASVAVQVRVACDDCPTRVPLDVALDRGYVCERHGRSAGESGDGGKGDTTNA